MGSLLSRRLGYRFLDTGAMYRALTWRVVSSGIDPSDEAAVSALLSRLRLRLIWSSAPGEPPHVTIDGKDASAHLREAAVEAAVSLVSRMPGVREAMVAQQRAVAGSGRVIMVGRDIGTVVLPQADLKLYLTASAEERARRRWLEMQAQGRDGDYQSVLENLRLRDGIDSTRALAPLRPAEDAHIINTDGLDVEQVVEKALALVEAT